MTNFNIKKGGLLMVFTMFFLSSIISQTQHIPNTGETETFTVVMGDELFDGTDGVTGGPGGDCTSTSSGDPGDYPDCGCITTTTYCSASGPVTIEFSEFRVFGSFDWMAIVDTDDPNTITASNAGGSSTNPSSTDPILWNSSVDGDEFSDMQGAMMTSFTSSGSCLTLVS